MTSWPFGVQVSWFANQLRLQRGENLAFNLRHRYLRFHTWVSKGMVLD